MPSNRPPPKPGEDPKKKRPRGEALRAVGHPTAYDDDFHPRQALKLVAGGASQEEVAELMQIPLGTFYTWRARHPKFKDAIECAKNEAFEKVMNKVLRKALGGYALTKIISRPPTRAEAKEYEDRGQEVPKWIVVESQSSEQPSDNWAASVILATHGGEWVKSFGSQGKTDDKMVGEQKAMNVNFMVQGDLDPDKSGNIEVHQFEGNATMDNEPPDPNMKRAEPPRAD